MILFVTKEGRGPSEKALDIIEKEFGPGIKVLAGSNINDPAWFLEHIQKMQDANELDGIIVSIISDGIYLISKKLDIENLKKLVKNTGQVYESISMLAKQICLEGGET